MHQMKLSQPGCITKQPGASCSHPSPPDQMLHSGIRCNSLLTSQVTGAAAAPPRPERLRAARCAAGSARSRELPNDASDAILPIFASVMKILRKSCGVKWSGRPSASVRPVLARAAVRRLRMVLLQILRFWAAHRRWKRTTRSPGPAAPPPPRPKPHTSTTPPGSLTAASAACSSTWPPSPRHHRDRQPPDRQDHHADPGPAAGLHPPRRHHPDHPEVGTSQITRPRDFPARPEVHPPGPT